MRRVPRLLAWLVLAALALFTVLGAFLVVVGRDGAIAFVVPVGVGTLVAGFMLTEKLRREGGLPVTRVDIAGGVPLRKRRWRPIAALVGIIVAGLAMMWDGEALSALVPALGAAVAVAGALVLGLVVTGRVGGQTLTFEVDGLRVGGRRGSFVVRWASFARVEVLELYDNPLIQVWVSDVADLMATAKGEDVVWVQQNVSRVVARNRVWAGCDLVLAPRHFGVDAALFAKALTGYIDNPERRGELSPARANRAEK